MSILYPLDLFRPHDEAPLGRITQQAGGFQAERTQVTYRADAPEDLYTTHPTLDAAVRWVEANPFLPTSAKNAQEMYGRVLAQWGDLSIFGCLHAPGTSRAATQASVLVVMDAHHRIRASLREDRTGWVLVMIVSGTTLRRRRSGWGAALAMFRTEVIQHLCPGSMHEKMRMREATLGFDALATEFQQERVLQQAAAALPPPTGHAPVRVRVPPTNVFRGEDNLHLGHFWRTGAYVLAHRNLAKGAHDVKPHTSFDAAVRWIEANPIAPDLERFPIHGQTYGPVLWRMPNCLLVGHLGSAPFTKARQDDDICLSVLNLSHHVIGHLRGEKNIWTWNLTPFGDLKPQTTRYVRQDGALDRVCSDLIQGLHPLPLSRHAVLQAEMPAAHARIEQFLQDRAQLVLEFRSGPRP